MWIWICVNLNISLNIRSLVFHYEYALDLPLLWINICKDWDYPRQSSFLNKACQKIHNLPDFFMILMPRNILWFLLFFSQESKNGLAHYHLPLFLYIILLISLRTPGIVTPNNRSQVIANDHTSQAKVRVSVDRRTSGAL